MAKKTGFFSNHSKSSAAVVSLMVHAILIVIAFFFVAVSVIQKNDVDFEAKPLSRPKMNLRKLRVPVNTKKPPQQPKLRKQIVVKPLKQVVPDFKMPEIVGVKGGLGASGSGLGGGVTVGFAIPEIHFFGVKGKSEKILLILNGAEEMSADSLGGGYGFEIIKQECLKLIESMPPTALFNMIVYDGSNRTFQLFPEMTPASPDHVQKARDWLLPLNQVKGADTRYGTGTLGPGGSRVKGDYPFGRFREDRIYPRGWNEPVFLAMKQQADSVFLLTHTWDSFNYWDRESERELRAKWDQTSDGKRWAEAVKKARALLDEDNARRTAAGEPPRALNRDSELGVVRAYRDKLGNVKEPPRPERVSIGLKDFFEAFGEAYKVYSREAPKLGIQKKKARFSLNVIYFKQEKFRDEKAKDYSDLHEGQFEALAEAFDGECRSVAGLAAIKSYVD